MKKNFGYFFIAAGALVVFYAWYANSTYHAQTRPFSTYSVLSSSWQNYKQQFINKDGRTIDYSQNAITTSEGQGYGLLRAVWMGDKPTFDLVWKWTQENLQKRGDHLFGWQWGKTASGAYGFLPNGGNNAAADADTDIAFALIMAGHRWNDETYSNEAKKILPDIWNKETATARGKRYLIAGNWAQNQTTLIINPSYFAPYAWRIFAQVDTTHPWTSLIQPAYDLLQNAGTASLDKTKGVGLPPDWLAMDRTTGAISAPHISHLDTDYSFDAMRVPWRIGLDYQWNHDPLAKNYLLSSYSLLADQYIRTGKLPDKIAHDGAILSSDESPVMYATALGYFIVADKKTASQIYQKKIIALYSNNTNSFNQNLPYYEQNWLWFGAALYSNYLQPL